MSTEPFDPELTELARRLSAMPPATAVLSRDRLMFLAGQAAATRRRRRRHAGTLALAGLSLAAGFFLGRSVPGPASVVRIPAELPIAPAPSVPMPAVAKKVPPAAAVEPTMVESAAVEDVPLYLTSRFGMSRKLLTDEPKPPLPLPVAEPPPPMPLEELLGLPFGSLDPAERQRWQSALHPGDPS